jgi:hypothetical protein
MKALFLGVALLLAAVATNTFAADVNVNPLVMHEFRTLFFNATNVQWSQVQNLYKAEFTIDGDKTAAFFNSEGTLVATTHYITIGELSRNLRNSLKQQAGAATITEIFEVQSDAGIDYYATLQQNGNTTVLQAGSNKWEVYKK